MLFTISSAKKLKGNAGMESHWQNPGRHCSFVSFEERNLKALQCLPMRHPFGREIIMLIN